MSDEQPPVVVIDPLNIREREALELFRKSGEQALAASLQAEMYELFLSGETLQGIARVNKGIRLGAIVHAAVDGDWHRRREEYRDLLLNSVTQRAVQVQSEGVVFAGLLLQLAHKQHGDKIRRYLQTGKPEDLPTMTVDSIAEYNKTVEVLLKLTGQDKDRPPPPPPSQPTQGRQEKDVTPRLSVGEQALKPELAGELLKLLQKK